MTDGRAERDNDRHHHRICDNCLIYEGHIIQVTFQSQILKQFRADHPGILRRKSLRSC